MWLNFRGINYQAEVFLNGFSKSLSKGMFLRHTIDITDWLNTDGENLLAVLVHPPDHPGRIPPEGGQGGDHEVACLSEFVLISCRSSLGFASSELHEYGNPTTF